MAWTALPINASSGSPAYAAQQFRNAMSALLAPHPTLGARPLGAATGRRPGAWIFTAPTPGGAITVPPGSGVLDVETPVATSAYLVASDANDTSLTLAARHATLDRIDIVSIRIDDTDVDASGARQAIPVYTQGTAGSGVAPATPARCYRLGTVLVPNAGTGGATVVTMDQTYCSALGGLALVPSSTAEVALTPYEGLSIYRMDSGDHREHDGTRFSSVAWSPARIRLVRALINALGSGSTWNELATWDSAEVNPAGNTITLGTGNKATIGVAGDYLASAVASFAANANGFRGTGISKNATSIPATQAIVAAGGTTVNPAVPSSPQVITCAAGDVLNAQVFQNSGSSLNITEIHLTVVRVG